MVGFLRVPASGIARSGCLRKCSRRLRAVQDRQQKDGRPPDGGGRRVPGPAGGPVSPGRPLDPRMLLAALTFRERCRSDPGRVIRRVATAGIALPQCGEQEKARSGTLQRRSELIDRRATRMAKSDGTLPAATLHGIRRVAETIHFIASRAYRSGEVRGLRAGGRHEGCGPRGNGSPHPAAAAVSPC